MLYLCFEKQLSTFFKKQNIFIHDNNSFFISIPLNKIGNKYPLSAICITIHIFKEKKLYRLTN